jgi:UDP-N-acetylglucosamine acyltransferase
MSVSIHPTAIITEGAKIGTGTTVGAYSIIGPKVVLGKDNKIGPHVVLEGNTKFGDENTIFQFASVGAAPQDLKFRGEDSVLEIGSRNIIREFVTLQPGTKGGGMITKIGHSNLFMANCHVGHDAIIGDSNIFANSAAIAGHVTVGNGVTLGGLTGVHQFVKLGDYSLLGAGSMITKDIPPFCIAQGDRAHLFGINKVGLERKGYSDEDISKLRTIYKEIFLDKGAISKKSEEAKAKFSGFELGLKLIDFIFNSERGVTLPKKIDAEKESE